MRTLFATAMLPLLLALAALPLHAEQVTPGPPARESYLLQVVLLLGRSDGVSGTTSIPENVVQTLKDVESFLPYKSYQLLDTSLIRSDGNARSVLHGPSGREFHLSLSFRTERGEEGERLSFQVFRIDAAPQPPRAPGGAPGSGEVEAPPAPGGPVLSSSFAVGVGETIVVGTSKLNGGTQALLVLLTAIP